MQSNRLCEGVWGMVEPVILPATPDIWHLIHQQWPSHKIHHHPIRFGSYEAERNKFCRILPPEGGGGLLHVFSCCNYSLSQYEVGWCSPLLHKNGFTTWVMVNHCHWTLDKHHTGYMYIIVSTYNFGALTVMPALKIFD